MIVQLFDYRYIYGGSCEKLYRNTNSSKQGV